MSPQQTSLALSATPTRVATSRTLQIVSKVLTYLVAADLLVIAIFKFIGTEPHLVESFTQMHLLGQLPFIATAELVLAVGLIVPATRTYAAMGLLLMLAGAIGAHVGAGQPLLAALPAMLVFMMTMCVIRFDNRLHVE